VSNQKDGLACSEKRNNATPNGTIAVKPTNGDGNILKECVQPPRVIFVNEATADAQDCSHEGDQTFGRGEELPNAALHGRVQNTSSAADKVATLQNISTKGNVGNTDLSPTEKNQCRAIMDLVPRLAVYTVSYLIIDFYLFTQFSMV